MANNYKVDTGKPPVLDAVLIPYRRSLLAIAAMKVDMAAKHKLLGAVNPYLEWMQLPDAKARLANAGARHALEPWGVNTKDGRHLHITHAIVGLLMALELHLKDQEDLEAGLSAAYAEGEPLMVPAGADWREKPGVCGETFPVLATGRAARPCVKDKDHNGPHQDSVGLRWPTAFGPIPGCSCASCLTWQPLP